MAEVTLVEGDPLSLARRLYRAYVEAAPAKPAPHTGKFVLESAKPGGGRGVRKGPPRAGEPWTDAERMALVKAYLKNEHIGNIAGTHQRTIGALESELRKIGFEL